MDNEHQSEETDRKNNCFSPPEQENVASQKSQQKKHFEDLNHLGCKLWDLMKLRSYLSSARNLFISLSQRNHEQRLKHAQNIIDLPEGIPNGEKRSNCNKVKSHPPLNQTN